MKNWRINIAKLFGQKTPDEYTRRASKAKQILDDEFVQDALDSIEMAVIEQWRGISVENKDQADELKRLLWAAQQFRSIFVVAIADGEVAKHDLIERERMLNQSEKSLRRVYG